MTKNKLVFLAVLLFIAAISAALLYSRGLRKQIDEANARIAAESAGQTADGASDGIGGMSITGMEIVQGEKGRELWRLVAKDAVMSEQGGDIVAQKPYLTYYLNADQAEPGAEREILLVESDTGDVNQRDNRMRFVGNVVATHNDDVLTTELIIYDGASGRLNCPDESFIESVGMRGRADEMSWHLDDNTLHASGGVSLDLETSRSPGPGGENNR